MAYEQVESTLSVQASRHGGHGRLAAIVAALLLAASLASAAPPAGGAGNEHRGFKVLDKNGKLVGYTVTENMVAREVSPSSGSRSSCTPLPEFSTPARSTSIT